MEAVIPVAPGAAVTGWPLDDAKSGGFQLHNELPAIPLCSQPALPPSPSYGAACNREIVESSPHKRKQAAHGESSPSFSTMAAICSILSPISLRSFFQITGFRILWAWIENASIKQSPVTSVIVSCQPRSYATSSAVLRPPHGLYFGTDASVAVLPEHLCCS